LTRSRHLAVVGDRDARYETHRGIDRVLASLPDGLAGAWHATEELGSEIAAAAGIWIAPGTPYRDRDAVLDVIRRAREHGQPLLASCGGFQHVVLEYARSVAGIEDAEHYCNYGLEPRFETALVDAGLVISGHAPDAGVEIVELPEHPFFFGTMFQPQMSPRPDGREHPLLAAFLAACL
jgi:CTP synthase (UTP-ammonia lyase)